MRVGVFNTAFVGDLALMGRLIDALAIAGHEIVLFANRAGCSLYEFDHRVKNRIIVRKESGLKKWTAIATIAQQIRQEKLDVLIVAHKSITSGLIAILSRQNRVVSFSDASFLHFFFESHSTHLVGHESERYLTLASSLLSEEILSRSQFILSGDQSLRQFSAAFPKFFSSADQMFFICAPGSVWQTKKYPTKLLARVIGRLLLERPRLCCVLSGGPADSSDIHEVLAEIRENQNFSSVMDRIFDAQSCLPLPELIELTRRSLFVLTPDSAPLHIASATGTRSFAFFGPTPDKTGFAPLAAGSKVINHVNLRGQKLPCQPCSKHGQSACPLVHHRCLADLPPDAIAAYVLESLPT